ncbi:MAG: FtsQ-type POTRA domain-containing protein [Acidobacteriota bacterium]|nr:FtsQ-type POTRA domain-containing protein [Acidobacteriota bacterium]
MPGAPLEMPEFDDFDEPLSPTLRKPVSAPWWRPATKYGRIALALATCAVLGVSAYAYYRAKTFLEHDNRFRIQSSGDIAASGLSEVNRAQLLPIFGEDIGRNIFFVPLAERRKQLEQIPWVESATVMRLLPNELKVSIVERKPVAFVRHGQTIGLVDANGVLLDMPAASLAKHHYSFPVVSGINASDPPAARMARMQTYENLIKDLDSTGQNYSSQISEIDLTDPEDARVTLPEQGSDILAHFGASEFLTRYQRYKAHIADWRQQYPQLSEVDLRYGQQVVLQMNHGATGAAADAAASKPTPAVAQTVEKHAEATVTKKTEKPASKAPAKTVEHHASNVMHTSTTHTTTSTAKKATTHKTVTHKSVSHKATTHKASTHRTAQQREIERRARLMRERRARAHHQATSSGKRS